MGIGEHKSISHQSLKATLAKLRFEAIQIFLPHLVNHNAYH
jgi:hypothetical protein